MSFGAVRQTVNTPAVTTILVKTANAQRANNDLYFDESLMNRILKLLK